MSAPLPAGFFERDVVDVARDLVGATLALGDCAGRIVETEAYDESEAACHAHAGVTARTGPLFGPPRHAYVYLSYGIHELFNVVTGPEGHGAAVLIRAIEPIEGIELMRARRPGRRDRGGRGGGRASARSPRSARSPGSAPRLSLIHI